MNFEKVLETDATNLIQSPIGDGVLKHWHRRLRHLIVMDVHTPKNMVDGIKLNKFSCPTSSLLYEVCIKGPHFQMSGEGK